MEKELENNQSILSISAEAEIVLEKHAKNQRRKSVTIGTVVAGILMIPVIVCLICNLAVGHALDWFFIVLASLLVTASLTVVPFIAIEKKFLWTLGTFTASLVLLLGVINVYVGGNWFFLATVPVLLGLSVIFAPYVIANIPLTDKLSDKKGILVMLWDTFWLYGVIVVCGLQTTYPGYWKMALVITTFCALFAWIVFGIVRYAKMSFARHPQLMKAGIVTILSGISVILIKDIVDFILYGYYRCSLTGLNWGVWNESTINANVYMIILIVCVMVGGMLMTLGMCLKKRDGDEINVEK